MKQTYTSAGTSINRDKLPAVFRKASFTSRTVFDYGCGKYIDHIRSALAGKQYLPYDPYNQPDPVNNASMSIVRRAMNAGTPVDVVCSNVLNVINDEWTILTIADTIELIIEKTGGTGYVTVY